MERYNLKGKKLLILAGAGVHNKVVRAAKEMGIYTIVTDYLPDSAATELADESWMLNIMDVDGIIKKCKEEHIDTGAINFVLIQHKSHIWRYVNVLIFRVLGQGKHLIYLPNR